MYWLIESEEQLQTLEKIKYEDVFVEIIPLSNTIHPVENSICSLYIRPLKSTKGFMVTTSHSETLSVDINSIVRVLNTFKTIYVRDKKEFLHYLILKNLYDITLTQPPYIQSYTQTHSHFYKLFPNKKNINRIIPIVKHYEYCEKTFETLKPRINEPINNFYNNKATVVFNAIERNGIRIDRKEFEPRFHNVDSDYVYGQFNFKTLTTRPSNRFKGVNYAAINKENGDRKPIIPNNDFLFELDISAYHPTLLSHLVGYEFDDGDIHQNFADMYKVDYQKAKELTFKQLYGGVFEQYKDLEFFKKVQKYTDELWAQFKGEGYVECPISNHIYRDDELQDMKPQKLLNYILQATETSTNVLILWEMFKLLKGCKTKLILYTFDSFTFDVDKSEKETIKKIIDIFEGFKLKVKMVSGSNYGEMN
tara:strand:+ start:82 stop:1344 length:1263 start_codon:yes stop_codon:yes gene_type:complete